MKADDGHEVLSHGQKGQRYFSSPMGLNSRSVRFDSRDSHAKLTRHADGRSPNGSLRFLSRAIGLVHSFDRAPKGPSDI
jgi:hypothetical protein